MDANSELFKEADDAALDKNTYEIRFCELISDSLDFRSTDSSIMEPQLPEKY